MRPIIALLLSLASPPLLASSARADLVFETEPNNTFATANKTTGYNSLGFEGYLTLGDIDVFSLRAYPDALGQVGFALQFEWLGASPQPPRNRILNYRFNTPFGFSYNQISGPISFGSASGFTNAPGLFYIQLWATPLGSTSTPIGSTIEGGYRLTYRATQGTLIGSSVPEPSSVLLGLALAGSTLFLRRRKRGTC